MAYKLYSWVDVEDVLFDLKHSWPDDLLYVSGYWSGFEVCIADYENFEVKSFFEEVFKEQIIKYNTWGYYINLEPYNNEERRLHFKFVEYNKNFQNLEKFRPVIRKSAIIWNPKYVSVENIYPLSKSSPKMFAFNSVVSCVGNTNRILALAKNGMLQNKRVLVVDCNFNWPTITRLLQSKLDMFDICFADFITLIHGDRCEKATSTINLISEKLQNNIVDGIYVLPAFRSKKLINTLTITPEVLIKNHKDPYILTNSLFNLGTLLNLDYILVDLPHGVSDISFCFTLDPRVQRVSIVSNKLYESITLKFIEELFNIIEPHKYHSIYYNQHTTINEGQCWDEYFESLDIDISFSEVN